MDLLFLRLDGIAVLTVDEFGAPQRFQNAHLLPAGLAEGAEGSTEDACRVEEAVPWDRVETDFAAEAEALEEEWSRLRDGATSAAGNTRAILVSVSPAPRPTQEAFLDELEELARTADVEVTGLPDPACGRRQSASGYSGRASWPNWRCWLCAGKPP